MLQRCYRRKAPQSNEVIRDSCASAWRTLLALPSLHGFWIRGGRAMGSPVVLITGALTGIGRATALAFASEGARVVISGRREKEGNKLVAELRKLGAEAEFVRSDVRHEEDMRSLVDKTVERFRRLDVAVKKPGPEGVSPPVRGQKHENYPSQFDNNRLRTRPSVKY